MRSETTLELFRDLGIDLDRFKTAYDLEFFKRHNLKAVTYFNKRKFGEDRVVDHPFCDYPWYLEGLVRPELSYEAAVNQTPLSKRGKEQLLSVLKGGLHVLKLSKKELKEYISTHAYFDYLKNTLSVDDPLVLEMARNSTADNSGPGPDVLTIEEAMECGALGLDPVATLKYVHEKKGYEKYLKAYGNIMDEKDPYIYHFPDGNATVARLLVKKMIPDVGDGNNAEEIILSKFNYADGHTAIRTAVRHGMILTCRK